MSSSMPGTWEKLAQRRDDGRHVAAAIDQLEDFPGAVVELDHAFGVEQHMAVLGRFELEAEAPAQHRHAVERRQAHDASPRCQTRSRVTVWYGGRSSS